MRDRPAKPVRSMTGPAGWAASLTLLVAAVGAMGLALSGPRVVRATASAPVSRLVSAPSSDALTTRLDLSTASAAELEVLPGVGPALAGRIVAHREAVGAFASIEALDDVKGVGPRTIDRLRPHVIASASPTDQPKPSTTPAPAPAPIDLNKADQKALETLPGIGPALATRIIESRQADGAFESIEALARVRGIGDKTLEKLRPHVTVAGASATPNKPATPKPSQKALVDLNTADAKRLQVLPGIGPALAARIIEDRAKHGPFPTIESLARVRGIGPKTVASLRAHATVSGAQAAKLVPGAPPAPPVNAGPINVNAASAEQLQTLPGIGPALSARIVASRRAKGPFRQADDLKRVRGIGVKTAAALRTRVWFGPIDGPAYRPVKTAGRPSR